LISNLKEKLKDEALVSVIVPNYNHKYFLRERLESVLNQTYSNFEVILLDDGSSDGSQSILNEYKKNGKVTCCIYNRENSGSPFKQWKRGVKESKGEYIWIAESDDLSEVTFLESLMSAANDKLGLIYCKSTTIDEHGEVLNNNYFPERMNPIKWKKDFIARGDKELADWHIYINTIPNASACIFKKELADFDEKLFSMKYAGDWLFWARIMKKTNVRFISDSLNYWRDTSDSVRSPKSKFEENRRFKEMIYCVKEMVALSGNKSLKTENFDWIFNWYLKTIFIFKIPFLKMPDLPFSKAKFRTYLLKKFFYISAIKIRAIFSSQSNQV